VHQFFCTVCFENHNTFNTDCDFDEPSFADFIPNVQLVSSRSAQTQEIPVTNDGLQYTITDISKNTPVHQVDDETSRNTSSNNVCVSIYRYTQVNVYVGTVPIIRCVYFTSAPLSFTEFKIIREGFHTERCSKPGGNIVLQGTWFTR